MPTVLVILPEGFEELEAVAPIDVLRRAGVTVTIAALGSTRRVTGRNAMVLEADCLLADLAPDAPAGDALFLPGGPGVARLRADPRVRALVLQHHEAGSWLAAICAAPTLLHDAGLLAGRRYTAHPSVAGELTAILASERTVTDGKILTSRGAGTALDFGLALVGHLTSPATAADIHRAICA